MTDASSTPHALARILIGGQRAFAVLGGDGAGKTTFINLMLRHLPAGTRCALLHDRVRDIQRADHLDWVDPDRADLVVCGDMVPGDAAAIHELSSRRRTIFAIASNADRESGIAAVAHRTGAGEVEVDAAYYFIGVERDAMLGGRRIVMDPALAAMLAEGAPA